MFHYNPFNTGAYYGDRDPYLHSSYHTPRNVNYPHRTYQPQPVYNTYARPQFLTGDEDDYDAPHPYGAYGPGYSPREHAYHDTRRRQEALQRERERLIAEEEQRRHREIELERRHRELEQERRRHEMSRARMQEEELRQRRAREQSRHREEAWKAASRQRQDPSGNRARSQSRQPETAQRTNARSKSRTPAQQARSPSEAPRHPTPPAPERTRAPPTPEQTAAATTIQNAFRMRQALLRIKTLNERFATLQREFTLPTALDFQTADGIVRVQVDADTAPLEEPRVGTPRLAFTAANRPLLAQAEEFNRLLIELDGVPSFGSRTVRERRKGVVRRVEEAAAALERWWHGVWAAGAGKESVGEEQEREGQDEEDNEAELSMAAAPAILGDGPESRMPVDESKTEAAPTSGDDKTKTEMVVDDTKAEGASTPEAMPHSRGAVEEHAKESEDVTVEELELSTAAAPAIQADGPESRMAVDENAKPETSPAPQDEQTETKMAVEDTKPDGLVPDTTPQPASGIKERAKEREDDVTAEEAELSMAEAPALMGEEPKIRMPVDDRETEMAVEDTMPDGGPAPDTTPHASPPSAPDAETQGDAHHAAPTQVPTEPPRTAAAPTAAPDAEMADADTVPATTAAPADDAHASPAPIVTEPPEHTGGSARQDRSPAHAAADEAHADAPAAAAAAAAAPPLSSPAMPDGIAQNSTRAPPRPPADGGPDGPEPKRHEEIDVEELRGSGDDGMESETGIVEEAKSERGGGSVTSEDHDYVML